MTMTNVIKVYQDAITNAEKVWSNCQSKARNVAPDLSEGEIEIALSAVGATKSSIVNEPCEKFRNKINKAKKIGETFDDLASESIDFFSYFTLFKRIFTFNSHI